MKRKIFAVFCVLLIVLTCSLSVFADGSAYVPDSSNGPCPYEFLSAMNGVSVLPHKRYFLSDLSSVNFANIYSLYDVVHPATPNSSTTIADSIFLVTPTTYNGHSCYRVQFDFINGGFNAYIDHSDYKSLFLYDDPAYPMDGFSITGDLYFYLDYYVSDLTMDADVYGGEWVIHSHSDVDISSISDDIPDFYLVNQNVSQFSIVYEFGDVGFTFYNQDIIYNPPSMELSAWSFSFFGIVYDYDSEYNDYSVLDLFYRSFVNYAVAEPYNLFYLRETVGGDSVTLAQLRDFIFQIFHAPVILISSMLNFDIFGFNLYGLATALITICFVALVVGIIVKLILRLR